MSELTGRVAIVTGGGRGIGRAVALALAHAGATVAVLGRNRLNLDQVRAEITAAGGAAWAEACDVADVDEVHTAFARIRDRLGPTAILVNNAGVTASMKFVETDNATWERIMRVNATGPFFCCREVVPDMIAAGAGRIINIASVAALSGIPYSAAYSASKHALLGLTRSLALELAQSNITVNAVCPGWVETDMLHDAIHTITAKTGRTDNEVRAAMLSMSDQQRMITPDEVAAVVLRLAGPGGADTTGEAIVVA